MQTFDRFLNNYVDHDHSEYALMDNVPTYSEFEQLLNTLNLLNNKIHQSTSREELRQLTKEIDTVLTTINLEIEKITSKLKDIASANDQNSANIEQIRNIGSGIQYDGGTFKEPNPYMSFDLGYFI